MVSISSLCFLISFLSLFISLPFPFSLPGSSLRLGSMASTPSSAASSLACELCSAWDSCRWTTPTDRSPRSPWRTAT
jgi:hypothetical protein